MTDTPENAAAPAEEMPELDKLSLVMQQTIGRIILQLREEDPNLGPVFTAAEVISNVVDILTLVVPIDGVRTALLISFEATHEKPMSFIATAQTKEALTSIANNRRTREAKAAKLIIPTSH